MGLAQEFWPHELVPSVIRELQEMRRNGHECIDLLRTMQQRGLTNAQMASTFVEAFELGFSEHMAIQGWPSTSDVRVNAFLERSFAKLRISPNKMTLQGVSNYLKIELVDLQTLLEERQLYGCLIHSEWNAADGTRKTEKYVPPDVLRKLEEWVPDAARAPWWYWPDDSDG